MDNSSENWEEIPAMPHVDGELNRIRKDMRRRSTKIVLTSLLLAAVLTAAFVCLIIPAAEKLYWDPEENTHHLEWSDDLDLTMSACAELFSPSQIVNNVISERTGFATYSLSVQLWENFGLSDTNFRTATLERGKLEFPYGFWEPLSINAFERASYPVYSMEERSKQNTYETLSKLPDYIRVRAAVSFPTDLDMEQLLEFRDSLDDGYVEWVGIRNAPPDRQCLPLCGMKPFSGGLVRDEVNEYYPSFWVTEDSAENLETHFKSLLQYSQDQREAGRGIDVGVNFYDSYYQGVLDYVEEAGVYTYGCYVMGPAELFLELLDSGTASQVWVESAWIDIDI